MLPQNTMSFTPASMESFQRDIRKKQSHLFDTDGNSFFLTVIIYSKVTSKFVFWMSFFFLVSCTKKKEGLVQKPQQTAFLVWNIKQLIVEYTGLLTAYLYIEMESRVLDFQGFSSNKLQIRPEILVVLTWLIRDIISIFLKESLIKKKKKRQKNTTNKETNKNAPAI